MTTTPASFSRAIRSGFGAWAKLATFTPWSIMRAMRSRTSAESARRFTPKGVVGAARTSSIERACLCRGRHEAGRMGTSHRGELHRARILTVRNALLFLA
jgi:hypothetical protein